jgi:hypothetical protein
LSKNHVKGAVGGVTPDTYIAFLIIECMALPFALLISPLENVVRSDGTRIVMAEKLSTKNEFKKIKYTMTSKLILLSALWAVWSFFYSGSWVSTKGVPGRDRPDSSEYLSGNLLHGPISSPLIPRFPFLLHVSQTHPDAVHADRSAWVVSAWVLSSI